MIVIGEHFLLVLKRGRWSKLGGTSLTLVFKGHLFKLQQFGLFRSKPATGSTSSAAAEGVAVVALVFDAFTVRFLDVGPKLPQLVAVSVMRISYQVPNPAYPIHT